MANSEAREKAKKYLHDVVSRIKEQKDDIKKIKNVPTLNLAHLEIR